MDSLGWAAELHAGCRRRLLAPSDVVASARKGSWPLYASGPLFTRSGLGGDLAQQEQLRGHDRHHALAKLSYRCTAVRFALQLVFYTAGSAV